MPQLAPTQKARAVARKNEGVIIALIARGLNFTHSATKFATDRCEGSGFFDSGKPKIFTDRDRRVLRYYLKMKYPCQCAFNAKKIRLGKNFNISIFESV